MENDVKTCWIYGGWFFRNSILNFIKDQLIDYKLIIYDNEYTINDIKMEIMQLDIFSNQRKIVIIKSLIKTTKWEDLLNNIPDNCLVVFDNIDIKNNVYKYVSKIGKSFISDPNLSKEDAMRYIYEYSEKNKKYIDMEIVKYSIEKLNSGRKTYDVDLIHLFTEQCILYVGKNKEITKNDIDNVFSFTSYYSSFDIFSHLDKKDYQSAYKLVRTAIEIDSITAINSLFFVMLWRYRLLLLIKESRVKLTIDSTKDLLRSIYKFKGAECTIDRTEDGKIKPYYSEYNVISNIDGSAVNSYSRKELYLIVKSLENSIFINRIENNESTSLLLIDMILMYICFGENFSNIEDSFFEYVKELI
jgi:DNA polymerase III delta subunit